MLGAASIAHPAAKTMSQFAWKWRQYRAELNHMPLAHENWD